MKNHLWLNILLVLSLCLLINGMADAAVTLVPFDANWSLADIETRIEKGAKVNESDKNGVTPLMSAAKSCSYEVVSFLLDVGADPNAMDKNGWTPLMYAIRYNPNPFVCSLLISQQDVKLDLRMGGLPMIEYCLMRGQFHFDTIISNLVDAGEMEICWAEGFIYESKYGVFLGRSSAPRSVWKNTQGETSTVLYEAGNIDNSTLNIPCRINGSEIRYIADIRTWDDNAADEKFQRIFIPKTILRILPLSLSSASSSCTIEVSEENKLMYSDGTAVYDNEGRNLVITTSKSVTIPQGVVSIGIGAFLQQEGVELFLPASLSFIPKDAMAKVAWFDVASANLDYSSANGALYNKDKTLLIRYPPARQGNVFVVRDGTQVIADYAFSCNRSKLAVFLPNSIRIIGEQAFSALWEELEVFTTIFNEYVVNYCEEHEITMLLSLSESEIACLAIPRLSPDEDVASLIDIIAESTKKSEIEYMGNSLLIEAISNSDNLNMISALIATGRYNDEITTVIPLMTAICSIRNARTVRFLADVSLGLDELESSLPIAYEGSILAYLIDSNKWAHQSVIELLVEREKSKTKISRELVDNGLLYLQNGYSGITSELIKLGCNVNARDVKTGDTPLIIAARKGDFQAVKELVDAGAKVNAANIKGRMPIVFTVSQANVQATDFLLKKGARADIVCNWLWANSKDNLVDILIGEFCRHIDSIGFYDNLDYFDTLNLIIAHGADVEGAKEGNPSPLLRLLEEKEITGVFTLLVENGADLFREDDYGWNALECAVKYNHEVWVFNTIIRAMKRNNEPRMTKEIDHALSLAALYSTRGEVISYLIKEGAKVNSIWTYMGIEEMTPLMLAAKITKEPNVIKAIIEGGANGLMKSSEGKKAIDYARDNPYIYLTDAYWEINDISY